MNRANCPVMSVAAIRSSNRILVQLESMDPSQAAPLHQRPNLSSQRLHLSPDIIQAVAEPDKVHRHVAYTHLLVSPNVPGDLLGLAGEEARSSDGEKEGVPPSGTSSY